MVSIEQGRPVLPSALRPGLHPQKRIGGQGLEVEIDPSETPTPWSRWWILVFFIILVIIGLILWFIFAVAIGPTRPKDQSVRDLNARDIAACGNLTVTGNTTLVGNTNSNNWFGRALSLPPTENSNLEVILDSTRSCLSLTNQSGSIVTAHLPPAADNKGLVIILLNGTANAQFHVEPNGTDTIEGSNATVVETSSAFLISMGTTFSGLANWKQL